MSIIINLFGESLRYWVCNIPNEQFYEFEKIKKRHNLEWEMMLFDFDFLSHFGYSHWSELSKESERNVFLLNYSNRLEIKKQNKILLKIPSIDLLNQTNLFKLYNTNTSELDFPNIPGFKTLLLLQHEIGHFSKHQINTNTFDINLLQFEIVNSPNKIIKGIESLLLYKNEKLKIISEDVLVKSMTVYCLDSLTLKKI